MFKISWGRRIKMSHGLSGTPIYSVWCNMKATCKKCDVYLEGEWKEFLPFYHWAIENGYTEGLYLSRKDKNIGYIKENCEFVKKIVRKKHGMYNTRLYRIWIGIKQRCHNPKDTGYESYGAKGIKVCDEWYNHFETFYRWSLENGYRDDLTLDRINSKGNYEPSNCRWADFNTQANNKMSSNFMVINGKKKTITQWAEEYNISPVTVYSRYKRGIRGMDLFEPPIETGSGVPFNITIEGETKRLSEWSRISGLHRQTIKDRYDNGVRGKELIDKQRKHRDFEYIVEIDGVSKPLKQWVNESEVSYDAMLDRYKKGIRGKELLKAREKPKLIITIDGVSKSLEEWSEISGINKSTISSRYHSGKRDKELIKPIRKQLIVEYQGKSQTINAWAKELKIDPETLRKRYHKGLRGEDLFFYS